jgi:hypothetical protein
MKLTRLVSAAAIIVCGALMAQPEAFAGAAAIGSCGKTLSKPGSYVLSGNLTFKKKSQESCIAVSAAFVTIDLRGFTIDCAATGNDGIEALFTSPGLHGLVVRNGTITNCFNGIDASVEKDVLIDHLTAIGNNSSGVAVDAGSTVRDSVFTGNTDDGIYAICPSNIINNTATADTPSDIATEGAGCNLDNNATSP